MLEHDSITIRVGFVITTLVGEFHFSLLVQTDLDDNVLWCWKLYDVLGRFGIKRRE